MTGLPTSDWVNKGETVPHIALPDGFTMEKRENLFITHSFTHFDLKLIGIAGLYDGPIEKNQIWVAPEQISGVGWPTVFKKFVRLMKDHV